MYKSWHCLKTRNEQHFSVIRKWWCSSGIFCEKLLTTSNGLEKLKRALTMWSFLHINFPFSFPNEDAIEENIPR